MDLLGSAASTTGQGSTESDGSDSGETAAAEVRPALESLLDQAGRQAGGVDLLHLLGCTHDLHLELHSALSTAGPASAGTLAGSPPGSHTHIPKPHTVALEPQGKGWFNGMASTYY